MNRTSNPQNGFSNAAYTQSNESIAMQLMGMEDEGFNSLTEDEYRRRLEEKFKPIFESMGGPEGVPNDKVLRMFQMYEFGLPSDKLSKFLLQMDINKDGRVTWLEFYQSMIRQRMRDLKLHKRILLSTILAANPQIKQRERAKAGDQTDYAAGLEEDYIPESYLEAYNCCPPPLFIPASCIAQIVFFIIYAVQINERNESWNQLTWTSGYPSWSPLIFVPARRYEIWRYLSYMFVHQGIHHITFNVLMQLILGLPLEVVHKFWRVGPVFLAGVIFGSMASGTVDRYISLVGASGGCYALIGAHYAIVIMNWEELQHEWLNCKENPLRFLLSGIVRLVVLTLVLGLDFGVALYQRYGLEQRAQTSFAAHIGGLLAGLLVGIPVLKNIEKKRWEVVVFWISLALACCLFIFGVFWNIFYPDYPKPPS